MATVRHLEERVEPIGGKRLRIGCADGQARRVNERAIDDQWTVYLGEYAELVRIAPLRWIRLAGGSPAEFASRWPQSLERTARGLAELIREYRLDFLYVNLPVLMPILLMSRTFAGLDTGMLMIAHSVASETWLKRWIASAPWLGDKDVLICSTRSCMRALTNVSPRFGQAFCLPLCTAVPERIADRAGPIGSGRLLSIGRIEDAKNIETLLEAFAVLARRLPGVRLTVAGEYTGSDPDQIERCRLRIAGRISGDPFLRENVRFVGAVEGRVKERLFDEADALINLSTDPGETFGFNLIEAKSRALPVICTRWDGFREIVEEERDGVFVEVDWEGPHPTVDPSEVADKAAKLLGDRERLLGMREEAYAGARRFDYRSVMPQVAEHVHRASALREPETPQPDALRLFAGTIGGFPDLYRLDRLRDTGLSDWPFLELMRRPDRVPLTEWYPRVKPIIGHYAGKGMFR